MQEDEHVYVWKKLRVDEVAVGFFRLEKLEAVAKAAQAFASAYEPPDEELLDKTYYALVDALDALDALDGESEARLYVDGGAWGSDRTDGKSGGDATNYAGSATNQPVQGESWVMGAEG